MVVEVTVDNYPELKQVFALVSSALVEIPQNLDPEDEPMAVMERFEERSPSMARKGLAMALGDLMEMSETLSAKQCEAIDAALAERSLPTWSELRIQFSGKIAATMRRGKIRSETEYYALRNVVESIDNPDQETAWSILDDYEQKAAKS